MKPFRDIDLSRFLAACKEKMKSNPNERTYLGSKKRRTDVIKNSGPGDLLIWRQPEEDFNTNSTLTVMPGEEAIFIKGGTIEQIFESGTYKLSTENYPFISRLRNAFSGGISTFNCVVYFVRKAHSMEIFWGTDSPIQVRDPVMMIATSVRARGSYKVQVDNPGKFLTKMVGNNVPFIMQAELNNYFISEFQQHIKSSLARAIRSSGQEILGICAEQDILANQVHPIIQEILDDYGLRLITFTIAAIDIPENNPNRQKLEEAFANKGVMRILGDDWGRQQASEILHTLAANPGAGDVATAGSGMGVGMAAGSAFSGMAQQIIIPMQQVSDQQPTQRILSGQFVQRDAERNTGAPASVALSTEYSAEELKKLKVIPPIAQNYEKLPTSCISDKDYAEILTAIRHAGSTYERTPASYASMHEEDLRNTLLAALNATYKGDATGEAFRNNGKTDICIERENRAAFVAECKMWTGQKDVQPAVEQLDSYLTWRDCKTALIYFVRRKDFLRVLSTAQAALRSIPFMRRVEAVDENELKCLVASKTTPGQLVQVRVMLFNLYSE